MKATFKPNKNECGNFKIFTSLVMIKMLTNTRIKARVSQSADSFGSTKAITVNKKHCHGNWTRMGTNYLSENLIRLLQQTCRAWFYPCCKHPSCCATAKLMYGKTSRKNVQLVSRLCCKTSWIAMLRYLLPTKKEKKNLATLSVARQVQTWV